LIGGIEVTGGYIVDGYALPEKAETPSPEGETRFTNFLNWSTNLTKMFLQGMEKYTQMKIAEEQYKTQQMAYNTRREILRTTLTTITGITPYIAIAAAALFIAKALTK